MCLRGNLHIPTITKLQTPNYYEYFKRWRYSTLGMGVAQNNKIINSESNFKRMGVYLIPTYPYNYNAY